MRDPFFHNYSPLRRASLAPVCVSIIRIDTNCSNEPLQHGRGTLCARCMLHCIVCVATQCWLTLVSHSHSYHEVECLHVLIIAEFRSQSQECVHLHHQQQTDNSTTPHHRCCCGAECCGCGNTLTVTTFLYQISTSVSSRAQYVVVVICYAVAEFTFSIYTFFVNMTACSSCSSRFL